ncbi:hypothetical protein [Sinomicrobium pectinilyticum]|uniref:DUF4168 domain-containing protein n=1 Tax=Sinomicrobium pectinilyticum TaxID=1084421 RepID=A0A3N0DRG3_SINP1|nr:hypothetical protein [Sinomicrobium pectinilyticum]RNL77943.1 hypothetical protein ED312_20345 [Sinomicrobium pectinilyticum]
MKRILKRNLFLIVCFISSSLFAQEKAAKISEAEFNSFVAVIGELQRSGSKMRDELVQVIRAEGLTPERFNEIQYNMDSPINEVDATGKELAAYKKIAAEVDRLKAEQQDMLQGYLKENGLTSERYAEIAEQVQSNEKYRERLLSIIKVQAATNQ